MLPYAEPVAASLLSIRRYPVKAMGGEALTSVEIDERGLVGDRWFAVTDAEGHFASGKRTRRFRRHDEVFDYAARTLGAGVVVAGPEGEWEVGDGALDSLLTARIGQPMQVLPETMERHQDGGEVSLVGSATLKWCAEQWGIDADPRRLRVNLVIETDEPFVEDTWIGHQISIGDVQLQVVERIERCRTIDLHQDGVDARGRWLNPLATVRDMCAAVYADVVRPGRIAVGDHVAR